MKQSAILFSLALASALSACVAPAPQPPAPGTYVVEQPPPYNSSYCADCGTVTAVTEREVESRPNVGGAIAGAIIGGVVGHQFGSGRGNDVMTAGGAVAGGAVGSQVGRGGGGLVYDLAIRMDDGITRVITVAAPGELRTGSRVRIAGDHVVPI
ncbi:MAG TPA: glycine zipper 2TM domain-containing protein [Nevskiaceae bacterium]|nr:glycine zipper 2TM domain-containing protein [Nevskiaceae bacterium]